MIQLTSVPIDESTDVQSIAMLKPLTISITTILLLSIHAYADCRDVGTSYFANRSYLIRSTSLESRPSRFLARLRQGKYEEAHEPDLVSYVYARIRAVRYGDLTRDGNDEAVVAVEYGSASADFYLTNYFVFGCTKAGTQLLGSIEEDQLRARVPEVSESISDPIYVKDETIYIRHKFGSRPSPSSITTFPYRYRKGRISPAGRPRYRKLP